MCAVLSSCEQHAQLHDEPQFCYDGPCVAQASVHQEFEMPPRSQLDVLFVIDNTSTMAEEQAVLRETLESLLPHGLNDSVDHQFATISTDMVNSGHRGKLQQGAESEAELGCPEAVPEVIASRHYLDDPQRLIRDLQCQVSVGTRGGSIGQGLEAMRQSLSCNGPNRSRLGPCCRPKDGLTVEEANRDPEGWAYDPYCELGEKRCITEVNPEDLVFPRPGSLLMVYFLTDKNDCSAADGISTEAPDPTRCEWDRDRLTPVAVYQDVLNKLKMSPERQIVVSVVTGPRQLDAKGQEIYYNAPRGRVPGVCDPDNSAFDPEAMLMCCPEGQCEGAVQPTCKSPLGSAYAGRRYLQLSESFDVNGVGCPIEDEFSECISICMEDAYVVPFEAYQYKLSWRGGFCLDRPPACIADDGARCDSGGEWNDPRNYRFTVGLICGPCEPECGPEGQRTEVPLSGYHIAEDNTCPGGFLISLNELPEPGVRLTLDYIPQP